MPIGECLDSKIRIYSENGLQDISGYQIFGVYERQSDIVNGRRYLMKTTSDYGIWWACGNRWCIGSLQFKGHCYCIAVKYMDHRCLTISDDWSWFTYNGTIENFTSAGKNIGAKSISSMY